ncbi:MAG: DUF4294 domain-containing protein [Bacteroidales bacterium]
MTMMKKSCITILLLFWILPAALGQREKSINVLPAYVDNGDTTAIITLESVTIFEPLTFSNNREKRRFYRLAKHVKKVYPYARLAGIEFDKVEEELENTDSYSERRKIAKQVEKKIESRYKEELKRLKFTQGKILIKLIDRETSHTSFAILQEMRGRLIAGFWQGLGRLFGYNLKEGYDPENNDFDHQIETIVQMIEAGAI